MHVLADTLVVDALQRVELRLGQRRQRSRPCIGPRLIWATRAGDDHARARLVDDPAQRELRRRRALRHQSCNLARRRDPYVEGHT